MTKLRAIGIEGPEVVRNALEFVAAKGKAKVNEVLINPFRTTAVVTTALPKRNLELSVEKFQHEWGKRKPEPDAYRKDLERGFEFQR